MYRISWPNRITIARILLVAPFVIVLLQLQDPRWGHHARWVALAIFTVMAGSDGLDGYLARRLRHETMIGRFLDPLADKLLILCAVIILAHEGTHVRDMRIPAAVAVIAIGKEVVVVLGFCLVYFTTARVYIDPRYLGKTCTAAQLLMVLAVLLSPDLPARWRMLPPLLWWIASILAVATAVQYFQLGRRFAAQFEANAGGKG